MRSAPQTMPGQQRPGADHGQGVSPSAGQSGPGEQVHALVVVEPRPLNVATPYDELLTKQGVLCNELRPWTGEIAGSSNQQLRP